MKQLDIQLQYWKISAKRNLKTASNLYKNKHRDACLFFCHLALEKGLKGLIVQNTRTLPPYLHDLAKLASIAKLKLTDEQLQNLRTITTFNIAGRYDDVKFAFYKKCTPVFTTKYFKLTRALFLWLEKEFQKK